MWERKCFGHYLLAGVLQAYACMLYQAMRWFHILWKGLGEESSPG